MVATVGFWLSNSVFYYFFCHRCTESRVIASSWRYTKYNRVYTRATEFLILLLCKQIKQKPIKPSSSRLYRRHFQSWRLFPIAVHLQESNRTKDKAICYTRWREICRKVVAERGGINHPRRTKGKQRSAFQREKVRRGRCRCAFSNWSLRKKVIRKTRRGTDGRTQKQRQRQRHKRGSNRVTANTQKIWRRV